MASVWGELKRRNVVKVAVAYAIVAWLLIEVASTVFPIVQLPDWTVTFLTMLILFGFPVALILSWAYELTPEGMKRSHEVEATEGVSHVTGRKIDFAIIGALVLALGFVVVDNYMLVDEASVLPNSVAVLPFDNLSPNPDNAFFSAGIHEEILNYLVKIRNLNVIARTSVLQYAGAERPITEIANELNVSTVMEGSVSYADGRVAVSAQLIDAETGLHLWSERYNREFADVFGIQADIAMNIANALEAEFSLEEQEQIEKVPTESDAAYALYLRAIESNDFDVRIAYLDQAIEEDENFALAYAQKAHWLSYRLIGAGGIGVAGRAERELILMEAAYSAIELDDSLGTAYAALGTVHTANWRAEEAEEAFQKALAMRPVAEVFLLYARFKRYRGEHAEAIRLLERAVELDPNNSANYGQLGIARTRARDFDGAAIALQTSLDLNPTSEATLGNLAVTEIARGNDDTALRHIEILENSNPSTGRLSQLALAYRLMGRFEDAERSFTEFEKRAMEDPVSNGWWARAYIGAGDFEQALQSVTLAVQQRDLGDIVPLTILAANQWDIPELNQPEFRDLLDNLWDE